MNWPGSRAVKIKNNMMKNTTVIMLVALMFVSCANVQEKEYANHSYINSGTLMGSYISGENTYLQQVVESRQVIEEGESIRFLGIVLNGEIDDMIINKAIRNSEADGLLVVRKSVSRKGFWPLFWKTSVKIIGKPVYYKQVNRNIAESYPDIAKRKIAREYYAKENELRNLWRVYYGLKANRGASVSSGGGYSSQGVRRLTWFSPECSSGACRQKKVEGAFALRVMGDVLFWPFALASYALTGNTLSTTRAM